MYRAIYMYIGIRSAHGARDHDRRRTAGPGNAITDVPGVRVGHVTLIEGEGPLSWAAGPVRTGVTVVLPP